MDNKLDKWKREAFEEAFEPFAQLLMVNFIRHLTNPEQYHWSVVQAAWEMFQEGYTLGEGRC